MKILRFICNFLLFFILCLVLSLLQIGIYDIIAAQSSDLSGIHVAGNDDTVAYFDSYGFWASDISTSFKQPSKYRIRNWGSSDGWKNATGWADAAIDFVIAAVKPIVVPLAQVNAVKEYTGRDISYFYSYLYEQYGNETAVNNALYELYIIFEKGNGNIPPVAVYSEEVRTCVPSEDKLISEWEYTGSITQGKKTANDYARWARDNKPLYNTTWKLNKYNSGSYELYRVKFVSEDNYGSRHIKAAAVLLYYQQYLSIIVALIFVIKYPISFLQGRYVSGKKKNSNRDDVSL